MTKTDRALIGQEVAEIVQAQLAPFIDQVNQLGASVLAALEGGKAVKTVADIMRDYGYSRRVVTGNPWLMPNFGKSDFPGRVKKWTPKTYKEWFSVPMEQRRMEWGLLPVKQKDKLKAGK